MSDDLHYWTGRADDRVLEAISRLFGTVGDHKPLELLRWQYNPPAGAAYVAFAHTSDDPFMSAVAVYVVLPFTVITGEATLNFVQSIDTLTLPSHRGRGLVSILAEKVYSLAASDGAVAVHGFPNDSFNPVAVGRLGWHSMDPLPFLARPVGLRYLRRRARWRRTASKSLEFKRSRRQSHIAVVLDVPPDIESLSSVGSEGKVQVRRDRSFLSWRLSRPGVKYLLLESRDAEGRLKAFGAATIADKHGCSLGYLIDVLASPDETRAARQVARSLTASLTAAGADLVLAWGFRSSWLRLYVWACFVPMPRFLRPIQIHFGSRLFSVECSTTDINRRSAWHLSYADSDTV